MNTRLERVRRGGLLWAAFTALFLIFYAGPRHFRDSYFLTKDAKEATAVLTEQRQHGVFRYKYSVAGHEYSGASQRNWEQEKYRNVEVGNESVVFYSASHPWISSLETPQFPPRDTSFYFGVPLIVGIAIILILCFDKSVKDSSECSFELGEHIIIKRVGSSESLFARIPDIVSWKALGRRETAVRFSDHTIIAFDSSGSLRTILKQAAGEREDRKANA